MGVNTTAWFCFGGGGGCNLITHCVCMCWTEKHWWYAVLLNIACELNPPPSLPCRWLPNPVHSAGGQCNSHLSDTANCVRVSHRFLRSRPLTSSVRLPDFVQEFNDLLVQDKDNGDIQTHPAQPRNRAFVEPVAQKKSWVTKLEW